MKSRLRAKSARVRVPVRTRSLSTGEEEDTGPNTDTHHIDHTNTPTHETHTIKESADDGRQSKNSQLKQEETKALKENDVLTLTQNGDLSDSDSDISFQHEASSEKDIF